MKFASIALGAVAASTASSADSDATVKWYIEGVRGFNEGFDKALYKTHITDSNDKCFDQKTLDNLMVYSGLITDPFSLITNFDVEKDINIISDGAEIIQDLAGCKFEGPAIDIMDFCADNKDNCNMKTLMDNLTKNMFVLVGKITSIAELFGNEDGDPDSAF